MYTFSSPGFPYPEASGAQGACTNQDAFPATVFSVNLTQFTATPDKANVDLSWETSAETNNDRFEVTRSYDPAGGFTTIGTVVGSGTTEATSRYAFTDRSAAPGTVYYRLSQVDTDGTTTFSPIVSVELGVTNELGLSAYPNPAATGSRLTVRLDGEWTEGGTDIRLLDASGRLVTEWNGQRAGRLNAILPDVPAGVYQLVATDAANSRTTRLVIR